MPRKMAVLKLLSLSKLKMFCLTSNLAYVAVAILLSSNVTPAWSQIPIKEITKHDCEKYCHMNCDDIPKHEEHHRERCRGVHNTDSICSCHFGGVWFGVFVALGLAAALLLACCFCRFCRRRGEAARIVVVTKPETITTIIHHQQEHGFEHKGKKSRKHTQHIYSIETVTQPEYSAVSIPSINSFASIEDQNNNNNNNSNSNSSFNNHHDAVTIIKSSRKKKGSAYDNLIEDDDDKDRRPSSALSDRIFFVNPPNNKEEPDEHMFAPPRY